MTFYPGTLKPNDVACWTLTLYFHKLRELIALKLAETEPWLSGEIEVDENYF